jgi:hypothetical protein
MIHKFRWKRIYVSAIQLAARKPYPARGGLWNGSQRHTGIKNKNIAIYHIKPINKQFFLAPSRI